MFTKLWRFSICVLIFNSPALADSSAVGEVQYFKNPEIDFWKKDEAAQNSTIKDHQEKRPTAPTIANNKSGFAWNKYLSPSNDEFFKEGDYTPPAPFMEIARNPSDENIENWFRYLETKNELLRNLQEKLTQY